MLKSKSVTFGWPSLCPPWEPVHVALTSEDHSFSLVCDSVPGGDRCCSRSEQRRLLRTPGNVIREVSLSRHGNGVHQGVRGWIIKRHKHSEEANPTQPWYRMKQDKTQCRHAVLSFPLFKWCYSSCTVWLSSCRESEVDWTEDRSCLGHDHIAAPVWPVSVDKPTQQNIFITFKTKERQYCRLLFKILGKYGVMLNM